MKKAVILLFAVAVGIAACHNFEDDNELHPNFGTTTGYFSYQFPVRTIILGDYIYDNSNDNDHKCIIYAHIGGVRENESDRKFTIEVDNSLCDNILFTSGGNTIVAMPADYYSLSSNTELVIPKGSMFGGVEVQLSEAFFNDPLAIKNTYVVPIRLKSSNDVDSILGGFSEFTADERIVNEWMIAPKNFTMYAIKYINEYDAVYLHYGNSSVKDGSGTTLGDSIYQERYVEYNRTYKLATTGRRTVQSASIPLKSKYMPGTISLQLEFDDANNCTITGSGTNTRTENGVTYTTNYQVTGNESGKFVSKQKDSYTSWGDKDRDVINNLKYTVVVASTDDPTIDPSSVYTAEDVFVIQARDVAMETYSPALVKAP